MIFRTYEHYPDEKENNEEKKECIICFDFLDYQNNKLDKLNNIITTKICLCDVYIHNCCFHEWHSVNNSCPICRQQIYLDLINNNSDDEDYFIELEENGICLFFYCYFCKYFFQVLLFYTFLFGISLSFVKITENFIANMDAIKMVIFYLLLLLLQEFLFCVAPQLS
jgi:hypothetical protein